jgi:hypothetical protein
MSNFAHVGRHAVNSPDPQRRYRNAFLPERSSGILPNKDAVFGLYHLRDGMTFCARQARNVYKSIPGRDNYAVSAAFGGHRLQFRENESERKVEPACTGFAHDPYLTI